MIYRIVYATHGEENHEYRNKDGNKQTKRFKLETCSKPELKYHIATNLMKKFNGPMMYIKLTAQSQLEPMFFG